MESPVSCCEAHDGFRQQASFDDLLLILLSPDCLDIVQHDLRTGVSSTGCRTFTRGYNIDIRAAAHQLCWKAARKEILGKLCEGKGSCMFVAQVLLSDPCLHSTLQKHFAKYPAMASNPYDNLPLSLSSPPIRGLRIQQIALEIDQRLHLDAKFSLECEGRTVSGRRLSAHNAPVDWVRDAILRVEVKHGKLAYISSSKLWKCSFSCIKCALRGTRPRDLYDELWLGLHFLKYHGRFGLSTSGLSTAVTGHQVQVYGPSQEVDSRVAAQDILVKLLHSGCVLLAQVFWDR